MEFNPFTLDYLKIDVYIKDKGSMLAQVALTYGDLYIQGFRVMSSSFGDGLFVTPPTIRGRSGAYIWVAKITNPSVWVELENMIKERYKEVRLEYKQETSDLPSEIVEIDPNDIPL
jgi:DNA-binding cell septation regulator SpoVG